MGTIRFSSYPDGDTNKGTCTFSEISITDRTNIPRENSSKGVYIGSTKARAVFKGNVQIWPEIKTLIFKNPTVGLPTVSLASNFKLLDVDMIFPEWNLYSNLTGSDILTSGINKYIKKGNYTQPVYKFDVYLSNGTTRLPLAKNSIINLKGNDIIAEWFDYDGAHILASAAVTLAFQNMQSDFPIKGFAYLKGNNSNKAELFLASGPATNAYYNYSDGHKMFMTPRLPLELPKNVTITRNKPTVSFSVASGNSNAVVINSPILISPPSPDYGTVLKNYPLSFGFMDKPANSGSSTPHTSYVLHDIANTTYTSFRYIFQGCSWDPSCVSYNISYSTLLNDGNNLTLSNIGDPRSSNTAKRPLAYIGNQFDRYTSAKNVTTTSIIHLALSKTSSPTNTFFSGRGKYQSGFYQGFYVNGNIHYIDWIKYNNSGNLTQGLANNIGTVTGKLGLNGINGNSYTVTNQRLLTDVGVNHTSIYPTPSETTYYCLRKGASSGGTYDRDYYTTASIPQTGDYQYDVCVKFKISAAMHGYDLVGSDSCDVTRYSGQLKIQIYVYNKNGAQLATSGEIDVTNSVFNGTMHLNSGGWGSWPAIWIEKHLIVNLTKNQQNISNNYLNIRINWWTVATNNDYRNLFLNIDRSWLVGDYKRNWENYGDLYLTELDKIKVYSIKASADATINFSSKINQNKYYLLTKTDNNSMFYSNNTYVAEAEAFQSGNYLIRPLSAIGFKYSGNFNYQQESLDVNPEYAYYNSVVDNIYLTYAYYTIRQTALNNTEWTDTSPIPVQIQVSENYVPITSCKFISSVTRNYTFK